VDVNLPDLLRLQKPKETDEEFLAWRRDALFDLVEHGMEGLKNGRRFDIKLIDEQRRLLFDAFYGFTQKGIIWKARGGGGSLCAAIVIWLRMVYWHQSFTDFAGSGDQAQVVYDYTKHFWTTESAKELLKGDPFISKTEMVDGTYLKCAANSQTQARGRHPSGLILDEACQRDPKKDVNIEAALQMVLTDKDFLVLALSTFHYPTGYFQETWDGSEERGFKRYAWDCFDILEPCKEGLKYATAEDPKALEYCLQECPLTVELVTQDYTGRAHNAGLVGCRGKARTANGFTPYKLALEKRTINTMETWLVEHACHRPMTRGPIYNSDLVERLFVPEIMLPPSEEIDSPSLVVGLDWGFRSSLGMAVIGPVGRNGDHIAVAHEQYFTGITSTEPVISYLKRLEKQYGHFQVFPDSQPELPNYELIAAGFDLFHSSHKVPGVVFSRYKTLGVDNLTRYIEHPGTLRISSECTVLKRQLLGLRRDSYGEIIKKDDHGHDALFSALLGFLFLNEFGTEEKEEEEGIMQARIIY